MKLPSAEGTRVIIVDVDESISLFEEVFASLRDQFLHSPELGLDANLSQGIRHGSLEGALWTIFDKLHLTTKKDANGVYQPNHFWLAHFEPREVTVAEEINSIFRVFSKRLDDLFQVVRQKWIQIKTKENPLGLFDYSFTSVEIRKTVGLLSPLSEREDVFEVIMSSLWRRTDQCLDRVRRAISTDLFEHLKVFLDDLQTDIELCESRNILQGVVSLRGTITLCKTDLARDLPKIANWFQVESRKEYKNFDLAHLVSSVEQVLNRIRSYCKASLEMGSEIHRALPGSHFRSLWDLLIILFDNAAKHSGLPKAQIKLSTTITDSDAKLTCTNLMSDANNVSHLKEKVADLNRLTLENENDLRKLRQEGGSGVAKLHKIIRHDMGRTSHRIVFNVTDEGAFQVQIDFGGSILHEDPTR